MYSCYGWNNWNNSVAEKMLAGIHARIFQISIVFAVKICKQCLGNFIHQTAYWRLALGPSGGPETLWTIALPQMKIPGAPLTAVSTSNLVSFLWRVATM